MIRRPRTTGKVYTEVNRADEDTTLSHSLACSSEEDSEEWMPPEPPVLKRTSKKPAAKMAAKPKEPKVPKPRAPRKPPAEKKPRAPRAPKAPGLPKTARGKTQVEVEIEKEKDGEKEVAEGDMEGRESKLTGRLKEERVSFIVPEGPPLEGGEGSSSGSWGMVNKKEEPEEDFTFDEPCPKKPKTSAAPLWRNNRLPTSNTEGLGEGRSMNWDLTELLSDLTGIQQWVCVNIAKLLNEDNTVPFLVRYRKDMINHMDADAVRDVQLVLEEIRALAKKTQTVIQTLKKDGVLTAELEQNLRSCRSADELDHVYAPYKKGSKLTKARRAKQLGLDAAAQDLLQNPNTLDLRTWVRPGTEGLSTIEEVATGVEQILCEIIAKDPETITYIRSLCERNMVTLQSSVAKAALKEQKEKERGQQRAKQGQCHRDKPKDLDKFHLYWDFTCNVQRIQPHQTLAINRGESLKILTVKVNIPDRVKSDFTSWCINVRWRTKTFATEDQRKIISDAVEGSYKRLLLPLLTRTYRSKLTAGAEKESIALFVRNLRQRLLVCPIRGCVLMAVDPGYRHGCKLAILSPTSQILQTDVVFLHSSGQQREAEKLRHLMLKFSCSRVVIGNGTACRETESFFADLITRHYFHPLDVSYCITNEAGASIYSVSPEAVKEMPDLDPNLRSAVSIGRRVQDPLAELVKIDPKHIGIGTYQHDVGASALKAALDGVVQECVSFVGVDINICSETLMRHVAGLNAGRARSIAQWREQNGPFTNREQLRLVKGLGPKSYQQCAGFIRINPQGLASNGAPEPSPSSSSVPEKSTAKRSRAKASASLPTEPNPLDRTCIHPESYHVALRFLSRVGGSADQLGSPGLRQGVEGTVRASGMEALARQLDTSPETLQLIVDGLTQPPGFDIRQDFEQADFKRGIVSMGDLQVGAVLTGRVDNATLFGAFVDIGVGRNGLIHKSNIRPEKLPVDHRRRSLALGPGERVEVRVLNVDLPRGRIGLDLLRVLR